MENKLISTAEAIKSVKRIEFILEGILVLQAKQYALANKKDTNEAAREVLKFVDDHMQEYVQGLPPATQK